MTGRSPLVVVGDALLDQDIDGDATRLAPDAPVPVVDVVSDRARPGGAALAAALAARDGREVVLVTALGTDHASDTLRALLPPGVRLCEIPLLGELPVKTRVRAAGRPLVRVDRGGGTPGRPGAAAHAAIRDAHTVLVSDYGRGTAAAVRARLVEAARHVPLVWDPHPRGGRPAVATRLATPNDREARAFTGHVPGVPEGDDSLRAHSRRGSLLAERWGAASVAVTLGARGAVLTRAHCDDPLYVPVTSSQARDTCGAGDCFAATAAAGLADGDLPARAVERAAGAAASFVGAGAAGNPLCWAPQEPPRRPVRPDVPGRLGDVLALVHAVHARGGTVVATGGCFDLLHAGHVELLEKARRAGDRLIVCLNSDASVRRLKGPGRPLNPAADRIRVVAGLDCVDAVLTFGEDTPATLLRRLRPDIWVKGGDYSVSALPEAAVLREWGGQALVLPYLDGRSTTELARRAAAHTPAPPSPAS
ncbi:D-glycero-beta-D-manno-heptose 1-phosphate adenylyltransferase [Streptomyces sp. ACA25]|uniref:D-glycero-beta-D-manno-heptose 1-phosphate adenylyltransferase n=1 Tax=Streptomyces sp. ACA25 TaxID=3022596 RepID=UPI0023079454|nr:D-glycero-beta-D-manno-heptose 1-phosphate adenylyltransferase [Streptomyces sp. ACA25]MDB1087849.1 D-glycero-beta-D-manno-heptose 1-phosphate adenylyltransferase [Streptomyces sp. ACA25]